MPRVSAAFFAVGTVCLAIGMLWGMVMAGSENFTTAAAHAHLNLLGWVTMAIYGTFYTLTRATMSARLAWINFWLGFAGVVIIIPSLTIYLQTNNNGLTPVIAVGAVLCFLALLTFSISVFRELFRKA